MKQVISTDKALAPISSYTQAILAGNIFYISGQIPANPATGEVVADTEATAEQVMGNLKATLTQAGITLEKVVKTTIFLADMGQFAQVNGVYARYFDEKTAPTCETVQVIKLPRGVEVGVSCIAVL